MTFENPTYSVSEINSIVRGMLETRLGEIRVRGEISNFSRPASGHMYFTLKDERAQIRCALFKNRSFGIGFKPTNGQQVVATGLLSLYEARGEYQMIVERLDQAGEGLLQLQFEALKKKLHAEGVFDASRKRPLPPFPRQLAIITSATGAALQDILHVLERRYPLLRINLYPVAVQGQDSESQLIAALTQADSDRDNELILLARGGGSMEDLWSFNSEPLARRIIACRVPVVTGVGHEIDFTIADFAADQRAPTPSAAAELISPDGQQISHRLSAISQSICRATSRRINEYAQGLDQLERRLARNHPGTLLRAARERHKRLSERLSKSWLNTYAGKTDKLVYASYRLRSLNPEIRTARYKQTFCDLERRIHAGLQQQLRGRIQHLEALKRALVALSPESTLGRGYAIVSMGNSGEILRSTDGAKPGDPINVRLKYGELAAEIITIKPTVER